MSTKTKKRGGRVQNFIGDRAITVHKTDYGGIDIIAHRDPTHIKSVSNAGAVMRDLWLQNGRGMSFKDYLKSIKGQNPLAGQSVGSRSYSTAEYYAKNNHRHPKIKQLSENPKVQALTPKPLPELKSTPRHVAHSTAQIDMMLLNSGYAHDTVTKSGRPTFSRQLRDWARRQLM